MADELFFTPGGCRIDNGRCFQSLDFDPARQVVTAHFRDGSVYEYFGIDGGLALDWLARIDPGCYFNHQLWPGDYRRVRPPD